MHGTYMRYLVVGAVALAVGMFAAGTSLQSLLPILLVLACPLMMIAMMVGMRGHGSNGGTSGPHGHGTDTSGNRHATDGSTDGHATDGAGRSAGRVDQTLSADRHVT